MAQPTGADELEIKLRLPREAVPALFRHPALRSAKQGPARKRHVVSTYFDTPDLRLAADGIGLRMRHDGKHWIQTVKGPPNGQGGGGLVARPEYEWIVGQGDAMPGIDRVRLASTPWRHKLGKAMRRGVAPVFTTDFTRTQVPVALDRDTHALCMVDIGEIHAPGSRRIEPISEMEIELMDGDVASLFGFARKLAADLPLALETRTKAARGVQLRRHENAEPARAQHTDLPRKPTTATALAACLRGSLQQIEANADGVAGHDDPEWIHQMRIGTRRFRAALALVRGLAPSDDLARLSDHAKWLADVLGEARDLDVLATETLPGVVAAMRVSEDESSPRALRALATRVGKRRKAARVTARAAVASPRFVTLVLDAGALMAAPSFGATPGSDAAASLDRAARKFAAALIAKRHRKLVRLGEGLAHASPDARHAARIAAKKLRYAIEFFTSLFPRKRVRAYRAGLVRLQDLLGALNDATVAVRSAAAIAGADAASTAVLRGYVAARQGDLSSGLDKSWRDFSACKPFWS